MPSMGKRLSEDQFRQAIRSLRVGQQTLDIAYGVLVQGKPQAAYVAALGLTKGAVSQAVSRVRNAHRTRSLPRGYEQITAVLPEHQAYIVRRWAADAARRLGERP